MAATLYWPGQYYFYPIGNTSAVSLTRDIPPEASANLLLLPCGDPRNVLFTLFNEPPSMRRLLDFTCCDFDPGVIARNALLFTMIMDDVPQHIIWKIFFDMYLDPEALSQLLVQCRKIIAYSRTLQDWLDSPYGSIIRVGTAFTLSELRRMWTRYALSAAQRSIVSRRMLDEDRKRVLSQTMDDKSFVYSSGRSAGPLSFEATGPMSKQFHHYWQTGTTSLGGLDPGSTYANPTFLYSRRGETFRVHYGTDPLTPFHFAAFFGNRREQRQAEPTIPELVAVAQTQFLGWCRAFRDRISVASGSVIIRFILGDALSVAQALANRTKGRISTMGVAQWTCQPLELEATEYEDRAAPTAFNVVDTSNLSDHVGLLNILLATIPLLSTTKSWSGVLYTEFLLPHQTLDSTTLSLTSLSPFPMDPSTLAVFLGLCPVGALSGFVTASDVHELLQISRSRASTKHIRQSRQTITWKQPSDGDCQGFLPQPVEPPHSRTYNPEHLASFFYHVYHRLFASENPLHLTRHKHDDKFEEALARSSSAPYTRETFVKFLCLVRERHRFTEYEWTEVMRRFLDQQQAVLISQPYHPDRASHQDLSAQLHRYGLYTYPIYLEPLQATIGPLSHWRSLPALVRVYLTVPPEHFAVLRDNDHTPPLHAVVRGRDKFENSYQCLDAAFGTVVVSGTIAEPGVSIREAEGGLLAANSGSTPLIISFVVPTWNLVRVVEDPDDIIIELCLKPTPYTAAKFMRTLGLRLSIFAAPLSDTTHVHVVPERCLPSSLPPAPIRRTDHDGECTHIGEQTSLHADINPEAMSVVSFTARLLIHDADCKMSFANGAFPTVTQLSPYRQRVTLATRNQDLVYPLPVSGGQQRVRLARKSGYIEIIIPAAMQFPKVWGLELNPFPVVRARNTSLPWNMHRVFLDRLPAVNTSPDRALWLHTLINFQMSKRERERKDETMQTGKINTLSLVKDTIREIVARFSGTQGGPCARVFALTNKEKNRQDIFLFVSELRYDLDSHTIVCDGFVLPASEQPAARSALASIFAEGIVDISVTSDEMGLWRQFIPALAERCRAGWNHREACEHKTGSSDAQESETSAADPLCSCGRGVNVEGMERNKLWRPLAPFVTRVALSPLFAVSYLEPVIDADQPSSTRTSTKSLRSSPSSGTPPTNVGSSINARCGRCSKEGEALRRCSRCKVVAYCSETCQKADWKIHKLTCTV
ncbi:hypothetical protein C8Q78DRAFT_1064754 [Trametes maxima]|nr:hypothetical protein C8Q78DRAFT_1064754 [Trametes maxima]